MRRLPNALIQPCLTAAFAVLLTATIAFAGEADESGRSLMDSGTWYNALWSIGIFLVLLAILAKLAWKPALKALEQREKHIADTLDNAARQQDESARLLREYQVRLEKADADAAARLAEALKAADEAREKILGAARREAADITQRATTEIDSAKQAAIRELYGFAAELATRAAEKILRKELNVEDQRRLVEESLASIHAKAGGGDGNA